MEKHRILICPLSYDSSKRVWAGDITYLPTREGWLYLAVVIDLASRLVIGWSMKTTIDRSLVIDAMLDAIRRRRTTTGTIFHSDRGSQYASDDFRELLDKCGLKPSMSRKGDCWDNACVESFFGSMKRELGDDLGKSRDRTSGNIRIHRDLVQSRSPTFYPRL